MQNRTARIATSSRYYISADLVIQYHGWSTINDLIRNETAALSYKSLNLLVPDDLRKLFLKFSATRERVLRSPSTDFKIPFQKTINDQTAFHIEM